MGKLAGVHVVQHIATGLVENNQVSGGVQPFPATRATHDALLSMPADDIAVAIAEQVKAVAKGAKLDAVGIGFPGIIRHGVAEESPNLQQVKGFHLAKAVEAALAREGMKVSVSLFNDADATAAGIAATRGVLHRLNRVWASGNGVGYGRFPWSEGVWEGGHSVVTLDPKENFCGCGGVGHLEGFLGYRAMRMRFLDIEPEEIFDTAKKGDSRCAQFVTRWHRALAAATATSIHLEGPGKFFVTGPNARFIDANLLDNFLHEMVKMSPLQGSLFEVIATGDEIGIIGAAVNAARGVRLA